MRRITLLLTMLMSVLISAPAFALEKVYFYYTDPAGTPVAMTNENGAIVWRAEYRPFGEIQEEFHAVPNEKKFVGKEMDGESGLYYFGARYMEARVGRFMAPDPAGPVNAGTGSIDDKVIANPQRLNIYSYALNNPYRYLDPSGKVPVDTGNWNLEGAVPPPPPGSLERWIPIWGTARQFGVDFANGDAASGALHIGLAAAETVGVSSLAKIFSRGAAGAINISENRLAHVLARHFPGGAQTAGKSVSLFNAGESVVDLVRAAESVAPVLQRGGNFERIVDAGRIIGVDRATGLATTIYTVITDAGGNLVTTFPGVP